MATTVAPSRPYAPLRTLPPGPKGRPLVGITADLVKDPLGFFMKTFQEYGDIAYFHVGNRQFYMLSHPDHIQYVLQGNHHNYRKANTYDKLRPLLGNGLVTSEGSYWLRQRRLIQPAFHRSRLPVFASVMTTAAGEMLDRWQPNAENNQPLDVASEFMRVTLDIVSRAMFSTDAAGFSDEIGRSLPIVLDRTNDRFWALVDIPRLPTSRNRQYWKALAALDKIVYQVIEERRRSGATPDDLLTMLLQAADEESGERMTDQQLRDEVMTIYLAGHETTANALSWAHTVIPRHPEVASKLRAEVDEVLKGRTPTVEDVPHLAYTRMVIDETLRLFPSVWTIARTPLAPDEIGGYRIEPGVNISLTQYITHRHPAFWERPDEFEPERFSREQSEGRHPFAYFPFGGGPRLCIGNSFALMEATLVLAMIVQRYQVEWVPDQVIEPRPVVTLRPRYGVKVHIRPR